MDQKIIDRFRAKVQPENFTRPHMTSPCLLWTASCNTAGYGRLKVRGRSHQAHRIAFCIANDTSPDELKEQGLWVLHHCDNPPCCRPSHLYAGTHADNMNDKVRRGRSLNGALHGRALLTEADVLEIRALAGSMPQRALGEKFGVSKTTINNIIQRRSWKHLN